MQLSSLSSVILRNIQIYMTIDEVDEIGGLSMFWYLKDGSFWCRKNEIQPLEEVVATVVFDLPKFDEDSFCDAYGVVSYEVSEQQYQTPLPVVRLLLEETVDNSCELKFLIESNYSILALKSTSIEKTVGIKIEKNSEKVPFIQFLEEKSFKEICTDVYVAVTTGCLMYCLIEIFSVVKGEAKLRIFSRSIQQMGVILRLLRDRFPDIIVQENDNAVYAAKLLIEELKLYLEHTSTSNRQMARVKTDLLIP